jgi:hypothetical protein
MEVSGQLHDPDALPSGKEPRYPMNRRLGGPQSQFGRGGEEKNSHLTFINLEIKLMNVK